MGAMEAVLVMGVCFALLLQCGHAETHIVGGNSNWTIPAVAGNAQLYTNWVSGKNFKLGDVLVFNFISGEHDVLEVTKTNYDNCGISSPISKHTAPPVRITLNTTGAHYYICSIGAHCTNGQKLSVTVAASTPTPSPSPSPSSSTPPPPSSSTTPPPSSATPSGASPPAGSPTTSSVPVPGGGSSSNGPSGATPPATENANSASRLTASLGILSGVAAVFLL